METSPVLLTLIGSDLIKRAKDNLKMKLRTRLLKSDRLYRLPAIFPFSILILWLSVCDFHSFPSNRQEKNYDYILYWVEYFNRDIEWYHSPEALQIAENILQYQTSFGGWPKNIDMAVPVSEKIQDEMKKYPYRYHATFDNGATYSQLRFLAKMIKAVNNQKYILAFLKGFDYLLAAQYQNGGWPQFFPLRKGYYSHITFNDDAMVGVMTLLRDVVKNRTEFSFIDDVRYGKAEIALQKGIECILKLQIKVDGELTVWCAQYDEFTLEPAGARSYELPSLSGNESMGIVRFLMGIDNPSPEVIQSIQSAVKWFNSVKINNIRVVRVPDGSSPSGFNKVVIKDPAAPPIWARFYHIGSNKPFFCDRDGSIHYDLAELSSERRNDYGWLGYWPQELLTSVYPDWRIKWSISEDVLHK
jgi:PelA/Pel-15E family pectate lyase